MHVQAAQQVALADHLQVVHHGVVALLRGLQGACARARSDACRHARIARPCSAAIAATVARRWRSSARASAMLAVRRGDHLDLRLQEFRRDPAVGRRLGGVEECLRHVGRDQLGLRIDQEILFLDAERECVVMRALTCIASDCGDRAPLTSVVSILEGIECTSCRAAAGPINSPGDLVAARKSRSQPAQRQIAR